MSQIKEVKIRVFDLQLGMYVCRLDKEWTETSYPLQGFVIENEGQIHTLADECEYVYIDAEKNKYVSNTTKSLGDSSYASPRSLRKKTQPVLTPPLHPAHSIHSVSIEPVKKPFFNLKGLLSLLNKEHQEPDCKRTYQLKDIISHKIATSAIKPPKKLVFFNQELYAARKAHTQASKLLKIFMSRVKEGETVNLIIAEQVIHNCILSALRSPDALLLASQLHKKHLSIWEHSMRVSVLAINLGRYLNLNDKELTILGLCGMLHDIGALLISKEMLEEADNKIEVMQSHTVLGRDILLSCEGEFSEIVAEVAYSHHEYLNGSGFPRGLKNEQISAYARIITLIDLYVTLSSDSVKDKVLSHYETMLRLLERVDTHLDAVLVDSFCQCIGTYPVGCLVEMNTGEIGIVVEENPEQKLKPKIVLVSSHDKKICPVHYILDLASLKNAEVLYEISAIVHPDKYPELSLITDLDVLKNNG